VKPHDFLVIVSAGNLRVQSSFNNEYFLSTVIFITILFHNDGVLGRSPVTQGKYGAPRISFHVIVDGTDKTKFSNLMIGLSCMRLGRSKLL